MYVARVVANRVAPEDRVLWIRPVQGPDEHASDVLLIDVIDLPRQHDPVPAEGWGRVELAGHDQDAPTALAAARGQRPNLAHHG
jgi:hypothetical protein